MMWPNGIGQLIVDEFVRRIFVKRDLLKHNLFFTLEVFLRKERPSYHIRQNLDC